MRQFYQDYVYHMLRFYFSFSKEPTHFKRHTDKINYQACRQVMKKKDKLETELIKEATCFGLWIPTVAQLHGLNKNTVYSLINKTVRDIARKRGLI